MASMDPSADTPVDLSAFGSAKEYKVRGFWTNALIHIWHDRLTMAAIIVLLIFTLACFLGPPIVESVLGVDQRSIDFSQKLLSPGPGHLLGTDDKGRDLFIRLLYGGRVSLGIAYIASVISISIGVAIGLIAGYNGGLVDDFIIWVITTLNSVPTLFLFLIVVTVWEPNPEALILIFGFLGWTGTTRLVRGEVLSVRERDYVVAARAVGAKVWHQMFYHIFPNVLSIVVVLLALDAGVLILSESGLSFLGLGVQPPIPTWGNMLNDAQSFYYDAPHIMIMPGLAITITVLCFYLLGDGLRDALDPRSERTR